MGGSAKSARHANPQTSHPRQLQVVHYYFNTEDRDGIIAALEAAGYKCESDGSGLTKAAWSHDFVD